MATKAEIERFYKATEAEDYFPANGVCGNPVAFAMKWGLPLSRSYLRSLRSPSATRPKSAVRKKRAK